MVTAHGTDRLLIFKHYSTNGASDDVSELGHNWGGQHDPFTTECSPKTASGGSFIMNTFSVSGYDKNNRVPTYLLN